MRGMQFSFYSFENCFWSLFGILLFFSRSSQNAHERGKKSYLLILAVISLTLHFIVGKWIVRDITNEKWIAWLWNKRESLRGNPEEVSFLLSYEDFKKSKYNGNLVYFYIKKQPGGDKWIKIKSRLI